MPDPRQQQAILQARAERAEWRKKASKDDRQLAAIELIADALDTIKDDVAEIKAQMIMTGHVQRRG